MKNELLNSQMNHSMLFVNQIIEKNHLQGKIHPCIAFISWNRSRFFTSKEKRKRNGVFLWNEGLYLTTTSMLPKTVDQWTQLFMSLVSHTLSFQTNAPGVINYSENDLSIKIRLVYYSTVHLVARPIDLDNIMDLHSILSHSNQYFISTCLFIWWVVV